MAAMMALVISANAMKFVMAALPYCRFQSGKKQRQGQTRDEHGAQVAAQLILCFHGLTRRLSSDSS
jgi:hypothetical protein